jgi:predicted nucleotidyltransferase
MEQSRSTPRFAARDTVQRRLLELRPELEAEGVRHTSIFGSIARGDDMPESDIDLIVDLDLQARVGLFELAGITLLLQERLGRHVDVIVKSGLRPGRHDEILSDMYFVFLVVATMMCS